MDINSPVDIGFLHFISFFYCRFQAPQDRTLQGQYRGSCVIPNVVYSVSVKAEGPTINYCSALLLCLPAGCC